MSRRKIIATCLALVVGMLLGPTAGWAQSCPPGYFVIGGPGSYGCAPIYNGANSTPQPRQDEGVQTIHYTVPEKTMTFVAIAWHPNANDIWAVWNNWSKEGATGRALAACKSVMGQGCTLAGAIENAALVVARDENGSLAFVRSGVSTAIAQLELKQECKDQGKSCRISQGWLARPIPTSYLNTDPSEEYFPSKEIVLNKFIYIAWPKTPSPNWKGKSWIVSGGGSREMEDRILVQCKEDSGAECEIGTTVTNGVIVSYQIGTEVGFRAAPNVEEAESGIRAKCAEKQLTCVIGKSYDSRTPRFAVIDDRALK